jgi:hypothetical protein
MNGRVVREVRLRPRPARARAGPGAVCTPGHCLYVRVLLVCVAVGCGRGGERESEARPADPQRLEAVRSSLAAVGAVASAAALDLVLMPSGPLLVWAPPRAEAGGGILLLELDASGEPRGAVRRAAPAGEQGDVLELAAAPSGADVAVIYREPHEGGGSHTLSLRVPLDAAAPEPALLAVSPAELGEGRGRVAIAGAADRPARAMYMAGIAACSDQDDVAPCAGFGFSELGGTERAGRAEPWLSVPSPCPEGAVGVAGLDQRFFYAVCSWRRDAPATMAYAINVENYYARADEVLHGCAPLGMVAIDAQTVLLGGDCGVLRRAARLTVDMKPPAEFPLDDLALACRRGRASITATGWALSLDHARAELEVVLPEQVAPSGARALWTGSALLVAQRMSGRLELTRYTCAGDALRVESSASSPALPLPARREPKAKPATRE